MHTHTRKLCMRQAQPSSSLHLSLLPSLFSFFTPSVALSPLSFSLSLLLLLLLVLILAHSPLCQQLPQLSLSLFFFYIYISSAALSSITMRLGICSFISDILSTSSNICFCWTEGKVESNPCQSNVHRPAAAAVLWSKAATVGGLRASQFC